VAGLVALSGATGAVGLNGLGKLPSAAKQFLTEGRVDGDPHGNEHGGQDPGWRHDGKDWHGNGDEGRVVPCDPDELIAAIVRANAEGGAKLRLTERCTYNLTAVQGLDGLPIITQPITIKGEDATIVRAANAADFRIFNVGPGGDLNLKDVTVKGGVALNGGGGGGILVQSGGKATLAHTSVVYNRSNSVGGGIANYGITKVLGKVEHDKGKGWDGKGSESKGPEGKAPDGKAPNSNPPTAPANKPSAGQGGGTELSADDAGKGKDAREENESKVSNNNAQSDGGGIFNGGVLKMENTRLSRNGTGRNGGGLMNSRDAVLEGVCVDHNTAEGVGGGIFSGAAITKLKDSDVGDNTARGQGGGISITQGAVYLEHSQVNRNTGANGGAIFVQQDASLVAEHSKIDENTARANGGGIFSLGAQVVLRHSQVDRNKSVATDSQAGGIFNNNGTLTLTATKVRENMSTLPPGGIFTNNNQVTVDEKSVIIKNRPTNCVGSIVPVPNCFG
jgi:predicted outer membrane repeat protein